MMASTPAIIFLSMLSYIRHASSNEASSIAAPNVYRKVRFRVRDIVGMLQTIQEQISKDGSEDAELFGKYSFYCRRGRKVLEAAIEEAQDTDLESLQSTIEGEETALEGIEEDIAEEQAKRADTEKALKKAKSIRDFEGGIYKEESTNLRNDIAIMKEAVVAFEKGEGFDAAMPLLRELSGSGDATDKDRDLLKAFVEGVKDGVDIPQQKGKQMLLHAKGVLEKRLAEVAEEEETEVESLRDFKDMAKKKISFLKTDIKEKKKQVHKLDEEMNSQKDDLQEAARYLMEGRAFLPFISATENCSRREEEWAERCHMRTAELVAITQASTKLTDDDFLDELFNKSLPAAWQEGSHHAMLASKQSNKSTKEGLGRLISLALQGTNASFAKFFQVLDGVAGIFGTEQSNPHPEKLCGQSLNQTEDNLKRLTVTVSDLGTIISQHEKSIVALTGEIHEVGADIQKLEEQVLETGRVRKQEYDKSAEVLTGDNMTLHLFGAVKDRLHAFYSQKNVVESDIDGVTLGEIIGPYMRKRDESIVVMGMLDSTMAALRADIAKVQARENKDQEAWEESVKEVIGKHVVGTKSILDKQVSKTELEAILDSMGKEKIEKMQEVKASTIYLSELQGNHTGFLKPAVCGRKPTRSDSEPTLPKHISFW